MSGGVAAQAGAIVSNVVPSVCLILMNKYLVQTFGFRFVLTLTFFHMSVLSISMFVLCKCGVFESKPMSTRNTMLLATTGIGSIAFMNLNLAFNSVGFYQLSKLACIPCTVLVQTVFWKESFSLKVKMSLLVLMVGIGWATVTDVLFNVSGFVLAVFAVISTTLYQILIGSKQKELEISQFQVLLYVAPPMAGLSLLCALLFESHDYFGEGTVFEYQFSIGCVNMIALTCVAAVAVNVSTFLLIRQTSALTYLVVGHAKTLIVLVSGFIFFGNPISFDNLMALLLAFVGVVMYSYFKQQPQAPPVSTSGVEEEANTLLAEQGETELELVVHGGR